MSKLKCDLLLLAAGFGKRLKPLTDSVPKPLIPVGGKPIIDWNLELISRSGVDEIFINLHYLPELIRSYVGDGSKWGLRVQYVYEPVILDTGGAIKNIEPFLKHKTLLTVNSDIVVGPDFSLENLLRKHEENPHNPWATLVLRADTDAKKYGSVGVDKDFQIVSFLGQNYFNREPVSELMYTGIQAISRATLNEMPRSGEVFSITQDVYVNLLKQNKYLSSVIYSGYWSDVGTPFRLDEASKAIPTIFGIS